VRWPANSARTAWNFPSAVGGLLAAGSAAIILTQPFPINLLVIPAIAAGIVLLLVPALAPILLVVSVPVQDAGALHLGGTTLTATKLALAALIAVTAIHMLTRKDDIRWSVIAVPFIGYLLAQGLSLTQAVDLQAGVAEIFRWTVALLAFLTVLLAIRSARAILMLAALVGLATLGEAAYGALQSLLGIGPKSFEASNDLTRAFGTFGTPNTFAGYLEMTGPWLAALAVWGLIQGVKLIRRYRASRVQGMNASHGDRRALILALIVSLWSGGAAAAALAGIGLSLSRGAWLGISAAIVAMIMVTGKRGFLASLLGAVVIGLFLAAGGINYTPPAIHERYDQLVNQLHFFDSRDVPVTPDNFAAVERMAHWQTGIAMFESDPVLGIGVGNFNDRYRDFYVHPRFSASRGHAHNYYIHAAAETGLVGLAAYLMLILTAAFTCIRAARSAPSSLGRALGIGAVGVTAAVMVHNVVEDLHVLNLGIQLSAIWALAVVALRYLPTGDLEPFSGEAGSSE
jgi:O-antigen ligase